MAGDAHVVSVVIPTVGRPSLARCLAALRAQTRAPDEIVAIQDERRRGTAWARNEGIRRSRGDLIAFTDDDCVPPPDWLERLVDAVDQQHADGAGGGFQETAPFLQAVRARQQRRRDEAAAAGRAVMGGWVGSGGNMLYARRWLDRCIAQDGHAYDESFRISQDWELAWRLQHRGARLVFVPVHVTHDYRPSAIQYLRQQFRHGTGIARLDRIRDRYPAAPRHPSLLWDAGRRGLPGRWLQVLWRKAFGPFDRGSFARAGDFWTFWLGEKFQGAGFLWERVRPGR